MQDIEEDRKQRNIIDQLRNEERQEEKRKVGKKTELLLLSEILHFIGLMLYFELSIKKNCSI
jgi:hypothetical protein